ncbi:MAG: hypothetical protein Q9221_004948 [Calogaya cf. arnoldii]
MSEKPNATSNPSPTLDPKAREAINKALMEQDTAWLLRNAGEACKQARTVAGRTSRLLSGSLSLKHANASTTAKPVRKPVGPPVSKDTTDAPTKDQE